MNSRLTLRVVFTLFCVLGFAIAQNCYKPFQDSGKADNKIFGQLETGHFQIISPINPVRYNFYRVPYKRPDHVLKKLDVGLTIIYVSNYSDPNGVDFSIRAIVKEKYFDAFFVMSAKAKWVLAHVHYVASSRDDFRAGSFAVNNNFLLEPHFNSTMTIVNNPIGTAYPAKQKFVAYAYLSGLKSSENTFNLRIVQDLVKLINNTIQIGFTVENNKKPIETVYVTYFAGMSGSLTIRLLGTPSPLYEFLMQLNKTTESYDLYGMAAFNGDVLAKLNTGTPAAAPKQRLLESAANSLPTAGMTDEQKRQYFLKRAEESQIAESLIPPNFNPYEGLQPNQVESFRRVFEVVGFGEIVNDALLEPIFRTGKEDSVAKLNEATKKSCIKYEDCLAQGTFVQLKDGTYGCVMCLTNFEFNSELERCECKKGFIPKGKDCVDPNSLCGSNQIYKEGTCYQLVSKKNLCDSKNNQEFDDKTGNCKCKTGFKKANDNKCVLDCPTSLVEINGKCACPQQTFMVDFKCVPCASISYRVWNYTKSSCDCAPDSYEEKGNCVVCQSPKVLDQDKKCVCPTGMRPLGISCQFIPLSPPVKNQPVGSNGQIPVASGVETKLDDSSKGFKLVPNLDEALLTKPNISSPFRAPILSPTPSTPLPSRSTAKGTPGSLLLALGSRKR